MRHRNERVELEMRLIKYRHLKRHITDEQALEYIESAMAESEEKLRAIDE
jgi:hypothetical protein